jgi:hypothetical protein
MTNRALAQRNHNTLLSGRFKQSIFPPVGQWNRFEITAHDRSVTVVLNDKTVISGAEIPNMPARGRLALQHHGSKRNGSWDGPPSLVQFKNILIKQVTSRRQSMHRRTTEVYPWEPGPN